MRKIIRDPKIFGKSESNFSDAENKTINDLKHLAASIAREFIPDFIFPKPLFNDLFTYFLNQEGVFDLSKGMFFYGNVGAGKSMILKVFEQFNRDIYFLTRTTSGVEALWDKRQPPHNNFTLITMPELQELFIAGGFDRIERFVSNKMSQATGISIARPLQMCFDDVGAELQKSAYFKTEIALFPEILHSRYNSWQNEGVKTHISTNLDAFQIGEKYGERTFSRLNEMFNWVIFDEEDRRLKNAISYCA